MNNLFRSSIFILCLLLFTILQEVYPKRIQPIGQHWLRRLHNLALGILNSLILIALPLNLLSVTQWVQLNKLGLFSLLSINPLLEGFICILILDLAIYWQHRLFHQIPLFWRMHQVHHLDQALDVTSGIRFHPLEMIASLLYKIVIILLLGPSVGSVLIFEVLLSCLALFNHTNWRIKVPIDRQLRKLLATPDFHRIHHSVLLKESMSNYGFNLSLWDHLFKSYTAEPQHGQLGMAIGLSHSTDKTFIQLLRLPFALIMILIMFTNHSAVAEVISLASNEWKAVHYRNIKANRVGFDPKQMIIEVNQSSSALIYPFSKSRSINAIKLEIILDGKIITSERQDDFPLRIGLILRGDKRLNFWQRRIAAEWLLMVDQLAAPYGGVEAIESLLFYSQDQKIGFKNRTHPFSELFREQIATPIGADLKVYTHHFSSSKEAIGLWLSADGDESKSNFRIILKNIEINPVLPSTEAQFSPHQ